jgi:hypothetical protein
MTASFPWPEYVHSGEIVTVAVSMVGGGVGLASAGTAASPTDALAAAAATKAAKVRFIFPPDLLRKNQGGTLNGPGNGTHAFQAFIFVRAKANLTAFDSVSMS